MEEVPKNSTSQSAQADHVIGPFTDRNNPILKDVPIKIPIIVVPQIMPSNLVLQGGQCILSASNTIAQDNPESSLSIFKTIKRLRGEKL